MIQVPNKNDQVVQKVSLRWQRGLSFWRCGRTSQSASPPAPLKGSLFILHRPKPPLEGRWHGASRVGEVAAPHAPTISTSRSPCRDGVGAAAGGGEVAAPHLPTTDTSPPHCRSRD